jgi:exodeoxyribonuclease VII small subunit
MAKTKAIQDLNYEQAFQELGEIVRQLETGDLPLEQTLKLFERGQALAARCSELLEQAELRFRTLAPEESRPSDESESDDEA